MASGRKKQQIKRTEAEEQILIQFGDNVRRFRKKLNVAQDELALRSQIHRTYIGAVERGEYNITLLNMCKMAKHLECDLNDLMEGIDVG